MAKTLTARVLKATSLLGSTQGVNMLCSIVRNKVLAVLVGPVGVGLFGAVSQAADMIGNFTQLNIRTSAVPALSAASAGRFDEMLISVRRCGRLLGVVGMVLMFLLAPLLSEAIYHSGEYTWAFRITSVSLLFVALQGSELVVLQATSRYKPIAASGLFTALTGMPLAVALYFWLGIDGIAPGIVAYSVLAFAGSRWFTRHHRPAGPKPSWRRSLSLGYGFVKAGILLTLTSLATYGVGYFFMAFMRGNGEMLGLYQAGYKMVWSYTGVFFVAFSMEFYPRLSKTVHNNRHVSLLISHQAIISSAVLAVGAAAIVALTPWLMPLLYSGDFTGGDDYVRWGMVGMAFRPLSMAMSYSFLASGRSGVYCATEVISALCGLALNVAGYRMAGFLGLGVATALWMFLELFIMLVAALFSRAPLPRPRALLLALAAPLPALLLCLLSA